jgi:Right handed beta helix region
MRAMAPDHGGPITARPAHRNSRPRGRRAFVPLALMTGLASASAPSCRPGPTAAETRPPAPVYYVDGQSGDDNQSGTSPAQAWRTLARANEALRPGDTVLIAGGIYRQPIKPARTGRDGGRIAYRAATGAAVVIEGADLLFDIAGRSYVTIEGFTFRNPAYAWGRITDGQRNEIVHSVFVAAGRTEAYVGLELRRAAYNRIADNEFRSWGEAASSWGDAVRLTEGADHNLLETNQFVNAGHSLLGIETSSNVVRGNRFENAWEKGIDLVWRVSPPWAPGQEFVARRNVIEANQLLRCRLSPDGQKGGVGIQIAAAETIFRGNVLADNDRAGVLVNGWTDAPRVYGNRLYHNTFVENGRVSAPISSGIATTQWGDVSVDVRANRFDNNVLYTTHAPYQLVLDLFPGRGYGPAFLTSYRIGGNCLGPESLIFIGSLDGADTVAHYASSYPELLPGNREARIQFANAGGGDYRLTTGSACIDLAIPLTVTTSSGSGRAVGVADASYFSDGQGVVPGDTVTILGSGRSTVAAVDYERNILTLTSDLQWRAGSPVFWREYAGARPDAGAFEFGR